MHLKEKYRIFVCIAGILVSIYAYFVEHMVHSNKSYGPFCELSRSWNCTAAFTSE